MTDLLDRIDAPSAVVRAAVIVMIIVAAFFANGLIRVTLRKLTRRAVRRAMHGRGRWTPRAPRLNDGTMAEQRRMQRADAAAHMFARVSSLALAIVTAIAIAHLLRIEPVVLLSSAGFLGAGIAFGGQTLIKDWLIGLLVLLEDRYAVGDQTTMRIGGGDVFGTVETLNGAGVRLRLEDGTAWHAGHGSIESVINHSQKLLPSSIGVPLDVWEELDQPMVGPATNGADKIGETSESPARD